MEWENTRPRKKSKTKLTHMITEEHRTPQTIIKSGFRINARTHQIHTLYELEQKRESLTPSSTRLHRCRDRISTYTRTYEARGDVAPFLFILNIMVPGTPAVCTVMYWALDDEQHGSGEGATASAAESHKTFLSMLERCVLIASALVLSLSPHCCSSNCFTHRTDQ